jgi:hypothetical protein
MVPAKSGSGRKEGFPSPIMHSSLSDNFPAQLLQSADAATHDRGVLSVIPSGGGCHLILDHILYFNQISVFKQEKNEKKRPTRRSIRIPMCFGKPVISGFS